MKPKLVIITNQRCGCHMLKSALKNHSELRITGEAFGGKSKYEEHFGIHSTTSSKDGLAAVFAERNGFILHRNHPHTSLLGCQGLWRKLLDMPDVYFLDLQRENLLARFLSLKVAKATKSFDAVPGERLPRLHLEPREVEQDFHWIRQQYRQVAARLPEARRLRVVYERVDYVEIQRFLGIEVQHLEPRIVKREHRPLNEAILNFSELRAYFAGTEWSHFFTQNQRAVA